MALNLKPLGDRLLVEPAEEKEVKKGGIIIPIPPRKNRRKAPSAPSAPARPTTNGKKVPFEVKKGDRVLVSKYGGTEIKIDGKEYKIFNSDDILWRSSANQRPNSQPSTNDSKIMAAKQLLFDEAARRPSSRASANSRGPSSPRSVPKAATSSSTKNSAPRRSPRTV